MNSIRRSALVPYSPHQMYALVADIASYPQFLPWCGGARIISRSEDEIVAAITIAYHGLRKTFTTRNLLHKGKMMEIRLVEGPFRHLHGYWLFEPLDADASKISVDLEFEVANRLVSAALTPVFSGIASELVDAFYQRARALHGAR